MKENSELIFNIVISILTFLVLGVLLTLGIYGIGQICHFIFHFKEASLIYLFRGIVCISIAGGVPMGITITTEG